MTYEREQDVVGWHRHTTDGTFESVATIYGDDGDEVWVVVKRTIGGVTKRFIELFDPTQWIEKEDMHYVDSGVKYTNPILTSGALVSGDDYRVLDNTGMDLSAVGVSTLPSNGKIFTATISATPVYGTGSVRRVETTYTGLTHLIGKTVSLLGDGSVIPDQVVSATGTVTVPQLSDRSSVMHIGLKYTSKLQPMNLDSDSTAGAHLGSVKQMRQIVPYFIRTLGGSYTTNLIDDNTGLLVVHKLISRDTTDPMDSSPPLFSGFKREDIEQDFSLEPDITIIQDQPLPMTLSSLTMKHKVTGTS